MIRIRTVLTVILFGYLFLFSLWLMTHTFGYDSTESNLLVGNKVWSDFGQHIPVIRSFSMGDNLTRLTRGTMPEFPLFPGEPIRYHFLFYALVGFLEKAGIRIDWALNLPSALGFFLLMAMIYLVSFELFYNRAISILSIVFFLLNGSLAFLRFFAQYPLSIKTLSDISTNNSFPSFAPWGPGDISAFWNLNIYTNQRHLGFSFGIALALIWLLIRLEKRTAKKQRLWVVPTALLLTIFPYLHQPTLIILSFFWLTYWAVLPKLRTFLFQSGVLATILILPQIIPLATGAKTMDWYPGYLIHDSLSLPKFFQYWWHNLGLHSLLIPMGFFLIPKRAKPFLLPLAVLFAIANLFKFSVEPAASHKFFNFVMILGNMITAYLVVRCFTVVRQIKNMFLKFSSVTGIILLLTLLMLSGIIDFFPILNDTKGKIADVGSNKAATWIRDHTSPDAVFLNNSYFFHPASIAGRKIFLGWPYFSWSAGYDSTQRSDILIKIYSAPDASTFCPLAKLHNITYYTIEDVSGPDFPTPSLFLTSQQAIFRGTDNTFALYNAQQVCTHQ